VEKLNVELRQSAAELSEADRRKDEFVAMLGHELRNPLSALSHALDLLGRVAGDRGRSEELRGMMVRQTQRIGTLLEQLLDIARVASGKVVLSKECIDLADVVRTAVETVGQLVEARKQELALSLAPDGNALVLGDAVRLAQVVENLLTNASKYTNEGGRIAVTLESDDDKAQIIIRDTGTGMSAELLPHVFEVFVQAPRTLERAMGGLGLGLPLVKRVVEMHEGHVDASSPGVGQGSEFVVTLPRLLEGRPKQRPEGEPAPAKPEIRPRRILVVDDEAQMAVIFASLLEANGHQTLVVHDGPSALAAVRSFGPDVVILDLGLPEMDGYEIARRIREEHADEKILLIAATGYQKKDARLKQAGFDQHLIKPFDMQRLAALIAGLDGGAVGPP
jgi:two-component system CheB/CheR fusion protein